jgi:4-amino-4-deoxychorismate lyase
LRRLEDALIQLKLENKGYCRDEVAAKVRSLGDESNWPRTVVKVIVSERNIVFSLKENPYKEEKYKHGASLTLSNVMRNETSPLTYLKTLNYGDNCLEKKRANAEGYDEVVFLNTGRLLTEGAVSNLFCVKENTIYTPAVSCGLLNGIMRQHVMNIAVVKEAAIIEEQLFSFDEMFITNSLMGIMPVKSIEGHQLKTMETGKALRKKYLAFLASLDTSYPSN